MFSPVACSQCGKPFQVPEADLGKQAVCPWCQATVLALPVATPTTSPKPELLSLDDAPPHQPRNRRLWLIMSVVGVFVLLLATTGTLAVLRYKQGRGLGWEWETFRVRDQPFSIELLGTPDDVHEDGAGQKRFTAEGWYSGTTTWVGWRDLTENEANQAQDKKDGWSHLRPLFEAEQDRLKAKYGGKLVKEATKDFDVRLTREVWREADNGDNVAERMIVVANGSRPRMYFVGMAGKFKFDGPEVQRFFDSFRVPE